ncbi:MAG: tRNA 2-thiocytidine biosynthesis protein TtcA [Gammaproteobacteria bacterium]|nr:tRNA 2-thiocytidine biosynthesis protein TtcA [Gammaproteobacteria bacterium]
MHVTPPKSLQRLAGRAIADYDMIRDGDRILLGLSGGKDSLTLLHILIRLQRHAPISFQLSIITIDPQSDSFDPSPLKPYIQSLGLDHYFVSEPIVDLADKHMHGDSYCAWCARMRRGLMYKTARDNNYNVLALAQHLDDLAESFLMSAFHGGKLKTMKAHYTNDDGDIRIIRPLVYARERQMAEFAHQADLPVIIENCPACFDKPTQRQHMKALLAKEEKGNKTLFSSLLSTMRPIIEKDI